jgi:hypothetical protein
MRGDGSRALYSSVDWFQHGYIINVGCRGRLVRMAVGEEFKSIATLWCAGDSCTTAVARLHQARHH